MTWDAFVVEIMQHSRFGWHRECPPTGWWRGTDSGVFYLRLEGHTVGEVQLNNDGTTRISCRFSMEARAQLGWKVSIETHGETYLDLRVNEDAANVLKRVEQLVEDALVGEAMAGLMGKAEPPG